MAFLAPLTEADTAYAYDGPPAGILYVEDFDAPEEAAEIHAALAEPSPPVITQVELDAARAGGRQEGLDAAREEQAALNAALQTAALTAIGDALSLARAEAGRVAQAMAEELAATMLAVLQAALPATASALAGAEIVGLISSLLPGLKREPAVAVQVHPSQHADIEAALQIQWPNHGGQLTVRPDATLTPADVRVTWADGEALRDTCSLWNGVRAALAPYRLPDLSSLTGVVDGG